MKIAKFVLIGIAVLSVSAAFAQQDLTGTITIIDRIDRNLMIQRTQTGTVGTSAGATDVLKAAPGLSLEAVHVGDKVTYATTDANGVKTLTKIEKQN